jgi:hypothetical protein
VQADHNLYFGLFIGQMHDQGARKLLTGWQHTTAEPNKPGLDLHSVSFPIEFKDSVNGDLTAVNALPWRLDRSVTADWGVASFAGAKAPGDDVFGKPRSGKFDVGAVATSSLSSRSPDGELTVSKDEGVKSAGVFTPDGMLVSYLFQNLPLAKGTYSFWLPARDYVGKPIAAGKYEVRLAESDFHWRYLNHVGDTGGLRFGAETASAIPKLVAFANDNTLILMQGMSEDHMELRGYDAMTGKVRWYTHGLSEVQGLAVKDGVVYYIRENNKAKGESRLTRVDAATGEIMPWPGSPSGHAFPVIGTPARSMAALGDKLYVAHASAN